LNNPSPKVYRVARMVKQWVGIPPQGALIISRKGATYTAAARKRERRGCFEKGGIPAYICK